MCVCVSVYMMDSFDVLKFRERSNTDYLNYVFWIVEHKEGTDRFHKESDSIRRFTTPKDLIFFLNLVICY